MKGGDIKEFRFGPVEFYLVGFDGDRPDPSTFGALTDLVSKGVVRVLDLVLVTRTADGDLDILEVEEDDGAAVLDGLEPIVAGLASEDDVRALAEVVPRDGRRRSWSWSSCSRGPSPRMWPPREARCCAASAFRHPS